MSTIEEEELEKGLIGATHSEADVAALVAQPGQSENCKQYKLPCDKCKKEFDSSATGANPILGLCSSCNVEAANVTEVNKSNEEEIPHDSDADIPEDPMNSSIAAVTDVEVSTSIKED